MSNMAPPGRSLLIRALSLAVLLAAINGWSIRHLGHDLTKLASLNAVTVVFGYILARLREREKNLLEGEKRRGQREFLDWCLDPAALISIAILFGLFGSFVTSITVLADGIAGPRSVYVTPEGKERKEGDEERLDTADDSVKFLRWTTPFGRPFYAEVEGYLRHSFDLYPWKGETLRIGSDLRSAPALLVRVPTEYFALLDGGLVRTTYDGESYDTATEEDRGSVILGRRTGVTKESIDDWRSELKSANRTDAEIARAVITWKSPIAVDGLPPLTPGAEIEFEFLSRAKKSVTSFTHTVTSEGFQDISLP